MARALCAVTVFMIAATMAEANQCSNGGVCPSGDEPQNLVSMLQTKLRMNVLEDGPSMLTNPSAMLTELEGMVGSGETPAFDLITTIKGLIQDDIMPCLQTTRDAAAQATAYALGAIELCNNVSKTEEGNIKMSRQVSVDNARSLHAACREAEKALYDHNLTNADSYCVKLGKFLHNTNRLEIPDGSTRDYSVTYVKNASFTNMCSRTKVTELYNGCTTSEAELADKTVECSGKQRSFESDFCTWKTELEANCEALDTCHSEAVTAYDSHVSKTQTLAEKWNVETAALQKILCYCNVWLSDKDDEDNRSKHNATQFDVCKDQTHTSAAVNYGTAAAKVACLLTPVANHPGTSGFVTQEYDNFADFVESVVPCPEVPCSTNIAFDPAGGARTWEGNCTTLAECQAKCTGDCTGFNWWPVKGGCHTITGEYLKRATGHTTIGGDASCTHLSGPQTPLCEHCQSATTCRPEATKFVLGEKGVVDGCPPGYSGIFDLATCHQAIIFFDNVDNLREGASDATHYPGCSFYDAEPKLAYFNTHPTPDGSIPENEKYWQVCVLKVPCSTNTAFDPSGGARTWEGTCTTLAECQAKCTGDCTGFNWYPKKGGCATITGEYLERATNHTTIGGDATCTHSSGPQEPQACRTVSKRELPN